MSLGTCSEQAERSVGCPIVSLPLAGRGQGWGYAANSVLVFCTYVSTSKGQCRRMPASDATRIILCFGLIPRHDHSGAGPGRTGVSGIIRDASASRAPGLLDGVSLPARRTFRLSGLASDPLRPEGRTIPPLPAVPSVRIVRRDDRAMRKGWGAV